MIEDMYISDNKLTTLANRLAQTFRVTSEEAMEIIYEEWDEVETLFHTHVKIQVVHAHLVDGINDTYRIA